MADHTIYFDPGATGANDGTSWANAHTSMQDALDNALINGSSSVDLKCRAAGNSVTVTARLLIDAGGSFVTGKWLEIIGCDAATGAELPDSTRLLFTANGQNINAPVFLIDDCHAISFRHIAARNDTDSSNANECGWTISNGAACYGYRWIDCKAYDAYYGWNLSSVMSRSHVFVNCEGTDCYAKIVNGSGPGKTYINCKFTKGSGSAPLAMDSYAASCVVNCVIDGFDYGAKKSDSTNEMVIVNSTFRKIGVAGLLQEYEYAGIVEVNNIYEVVTPASDYPVLVTASKGSVLYSDYGVTDAVTYASGNNVVAGSHCLTETDPQFADAANGDFRLKATSPCWNRGMPTLGSGYSTPGAWGRKNILRGNG